MSTDLTLPDARAVRDQLADRTDVLDKVGVLRMMPSDLNVAGTEAVAAFYEVGRDVIRQLVHRNREELDDDGYQVLSANEVSDMLSLTLDELGIPRSAGTVALFTRRAVLRVGMLLRDSTVARRVRDYLLDTEQDSLVRLILNDPISALEDANARCQQAIGIARAERDRADKAEKQVEIEQRHRRAIEGGDGILLTDFGKKYFSEVRHTDFFEHLYAKKWLIDQRGTRVRPDGEIRDGHDHRKPTYKGRPFIYEHDNGVHGGKRRFQPRVRPQREIELRDALAAEGLPVNAHSTGLVLITNDELKGLGA